MIEHIIETIANVGMIKITGMILYSFIPIAVILALRATIRIDKNTKYTGPAK